MKSALTPVASGDQINQDEQQRVMDKDRFRQDLGQVEQAYQRVLERVASQSGKN